MPGGALNNQASWAAGVAPATQASQPNLVSLGNATVIMSRATDSSGDLQPTRSNWIRQFAPGQGYHNNSIQCWSVDADGTVKNVYA